MYKYAWLASTILGCRIPILFGYTEMNTNSQTLNIYFYVSQLHVSATSTAMATLRQPKHVVHCYTTEQNGDATS